MRTTPAHRRHHRGSARPRGHLRRLIAAAAAAVTAAGLAIVAVQTPASADVTETETVVVDGAGGDWSITHDVNNSSNGHFAAGPGDHSGSFHFDVPDGGKVTLTKAAPSGMKLADIDTLTYQTYRDSTSTLQANLPGLNLVICAAGLNDDGDGCANFPDTQTSSYTTLVWEANYGPTNTATTFESNVWKTWDALTAHDQSTHLSGGWWSTHPIPGCTYQSSGFCYVGFDTIADNNPDAVVLSFGLNVGHAGSGTFTGAVDNLTVGTAGNAPTVYDFAAGGAQTLQVDQTAAGQQAAYSTIQAAIDAAYPGDTIDVAAGTYDEAVTINKDDLTIHGAGAGSTVIAPTDADATSLTFASTGATVDGVTVTHSYTDEAKTGWSFNNNGVTFAQNKSGNTLQNSTVTLNRNGIYFNNSTGNTVKDSTVTNNRTGINITSGVAATITGNTITDNWTLGLVIYPADTRSVNLNALTLTGNSITGNWYGQIELKNTGDNTSVTGTLDLSNGNTFGTGPVIYTTSGNTDLNEPGFTDQHPIALGGEASAPAAGPLYTIRVTGLTGATVNYPGKTLQVDSTEAAPPAAYGTIQAAIDAAAAGDIIDVRSGTYTPASQITVNKAITITSSASAQSPAIIEGPSASARALFYITACAAPGDASCSVAIQNLTFRNIALNNSLGIIYVNASGSNNLVVRNNVFDNVGYTAVSYHGDRAAYDSGVGTGMIVNNNTITMTPAADTNQYALWLGNTSGATVAGNTITGGFGGILIAGGTDATVTGNAVSGYAVNGLDFSYDPTYMTAADNTVTRQFPLDGVTATGNTVSGGAAADSAAVHVFGNGVTLTGNRLTPTHGYAVDVEGRYLPQHTSGAVEAAHNYWGAASPNFDQLIATTPQAPVTYAPWYTDTAMTTTASDAPTGSRPTVTVDTSTGSVTSSGADVNYAALQSGGSGTAATVPHTTITTTTGSGTASVDIPAGTTITPAGPNASTWDGIVSAPTVVVPPAGSVPTGSTGVVAISVGSSTVSLTFDAPVRLVLPGQAGKHTGFIDNAGTFTPITLSCVADSASDVAMQLTAGRACAIPVGADLVVWTTHFTTFVTYTPYSGGGGGGSVTPPPATPGQTGRIGGADRYETSALIADDFGTASAIVVANGIDAKRGVDALSANFLAGRVGAPILLTRAASVSPDTLAAVKTVLTGAASPTIYVMGGADSVSDTVAGAIKAAAQTVATGTVTVKRIAGANRYETSAKAAAAGGAAAEVSFTATGTPQRTAILASGEINADALAAGALSNAWGLPVLLTTPDALPSAVANAITTGKITQLLVVGGVDRVSQAVLDQASTAGVQNVERVAGPNRFATAAELYTFAFDTAVDSSANHYGATKDGTVYVANGLSGFPDALSAGPLAGRSGSPLLTCAPGELGGAAQTFLTGHAAALTRVVGLGRPATVSDAVLSAASAAL